MLLIPLFFIFNSVHLQINELNPFPKNKESEWIEISIQPTPTQSSPDTTKQKLYYFKNADDKIFSLDSIVRQIPSVSQKTNCILSEKELAPSGIPLSCHFYLKPWPSLSNSGGFLELWSDTLIQKVEWPPDKSSYDFKTYDPIANDWFEASPGYQLENNTSNDFDFRALRTDDSGSEKIILQVKSPCEYQFKINDNHSQKIIPFNEFYRSNQWHWFTLNLSQQLKIPLHFIAQCKDQDITFKRIIL